MNRGLVTGILLLLLIASAAQGQVLHREGGFGDRITGDVHRAGEADLFTGRALAGSMLTLKLGPGKRSAYRVSLALYEEGDDFTSLDLPGLLFQGDAGFKSIPFPLPSTGRYRLLVYARVVGEETFAGEYALQTKLKLPKGGELAVGEDDAAAFGALAGSVAKLQIKVPKGAALPAVLAIRGPGDEEVLGAAEVKASGSSVKITTAPLPSFGTWRVELDGPDAGDAVVKVKLKHPKTKGGKPDRRDFDAPPEDPVLPFLFQYAPWDPIVYLPGRSGGAAALRLWPAPAGPVFERPPGVAQGAWTFEDPVFDGENRPVSYSIVFTDEAWRADLSGITWDESDRLTGFTAELTTPGGPGAVGFSGIVWDAGEKLAGYTETRTWGADTFTFAIGDVVRQGGDHVLYRAQVTGPAGPLGTFPYPAWRLPDE